MEELRTVSHLIIKNNARHRQGIAQISTLRAHRSQKEELALKLYDGLQRSNDEQAQVKKVITRALLSTHPILRAVHAGTGSTKTERDLLPYIVRRDELASISLKLDQNLQRDRARQDELYAGILTQTEQNKVLLRELNDIVQEKKKREHASLSDGQRDDLDTLDASISSTSERREIVRNVIQSLILESGIDWVDSADLQQLMIECGERDIL